MRADNTAHLRAAAQTRHQQAREATTRALQTLEQQPQTITVAGLARAAGVTRSWLYTQPDILDQLRQTAHRTPQPRAPRPTAASDASWQRRLELAHHRITELTTENTQLRDQLARTHGQLRAERIAPSKTPSTT